MAMTYDLATDIGKVRLLINDKDEFGDADYQDEEIQVFLDLEDGNVVLGAARAFETLAGDNARLASSYRTGSVSEDVTRVAGELRAQAKMWRETEGADVVLETTMSPTWERFTYEQNVVLDRQDTRRTNP